MVGMLLTFWFLAGQTLETTESVSQRHQAQPHQRQGQQCSGVMKLLVSINQALNINEHEHDLIIRLFLCCLSL